MTGNTRRELSRKVAGSDVTFTSIDDVKPPIALVGGEVLALSNGEWRTFRITRIVIRRTSHRRRWAWCYHGTIGGVSVSRMGDAGMIKRIGDVEPV